MTKRTKCSSKPFTEDTEGYPVPILSFVVAIRLWVSKNPKKEIKKMFKLDKSKYKKL